MRTTLVIDDDVYRRCRLAAADRGTTVSSLVEQALRALLDAVEKPTGSQGIIGMPVGSSMSWVAPGIDIYDTSAVLDVLDARP